MSTIEKTRPTTKPTTKPEQPKLFRVILVNDDFTRFEVVSIVLKSVFRLGPERAYHVMMTAHRKGSCLVASYALDIAQTKVEEARALAREHGAPLSFTIEPDD